MALSGCATVGTPNADLPSPSSPMSAKDEAAFDNGADFVSDPGGLQGQWFATWQDDLDLRFEHSDLIAVIGVGSIARSEADAEAEPTFVLVPEAEQVFRGSLPEDLTLVSTKGGPGYASLERGQTRLLSEPFVLFVKWAADAEGRVEARFHLSPKAGEVQRQLDTRYGAANGDTKIVRHVN